METSSPNVGSKAPSRVTSLPPGRLLLLDSDSAGGKVGLSPGLTSKICLGSQQTLKHMSLNICDLIDQVGATYKNAFCAELFN